jgi:hypothetical protein
MYTFDDYLDLYRAGDETLKAALDGRLAPQAHYEAYFNAPFPTLCSGLGDVGEPLTSPQARLYGTTGALTPDVRWLQRALNTLLPVASRIAVDGVAGPVTLRTAYDAWVRWSRLPGTAAAREFAARQDPASRPYEPRLVTVDGVKKVAIERAFLNFLIGRIQVPDPVPDPVRSARSATTSNETNQPPREQSSSGSGMLIVALAAAAVLGVWAATRG